MRCSSIVGIACWLAMGALVIRGSAAGATPRQMNDAAARADGTTNTRTVRAVTGDSAQFNTVAAGTPPSATISIVPVPAKVGSYPPGTTIVGNELRLPAGGVRAWFEFRISGWDPNGDDDPQAGGFQATIDATGLSDSDLPGDQPDIAPPVIGCASNATCVTAFGESFARCELGTCKTAYTDKSGVRADSWCVDQGFGPCFIGECDTSILDYRCVGIASFFRVDEGTEAYGGTVVLDIPVGAEGKYTVNLETDGTFIWNSACVPNDIPTLSETGFVVDVGPPVAEVVWDPDPLSSGRTTRSLRFRVSPPATATATPEQSAIKVTLVDLQRPNPRNVWRFPTPNASRFAAFDTNVNGVCSGATETPNYNGHPCNTALAGCPCNGDVALPLLSPTSGPQPNVVDVACVVDCWQGNCSCCVNSCDVNCDGTVSEDDVNATACLLRLLPSTTCCGGADAHCVCNTTDCGPNYEAHKGVCIGNPAPPLVACAGSGEDLTPDAGGGFQGGCARWVGKPGTFMESQGPPSNGPFRAARLQCTPFYYDWVTETAGGTIAVVGAEIVPSSEYSVQAYGPSCKGAEGGCTNVSAPVQMLTRRSGDVASEFNPPATTTGQPSALDVTRLVDKLKDVAGAPVKAISQIQPNLVELNGDVSALDIVAGVDAVKELPYSFSGPCPCPSLATCNALACSTPTTCIDSALPGLGAGSTCVKTCRSGDNVGDPCVNHSHCPGGFCGEVLRCASGPNAGLDCASDAGCPMGTCGWGYCRDRCGRCD